MEESTDYGIVVYAVEALDDLFCVGGDHSTAATAVLPSPIRPTALAAVNQNGRIGVNSSLASPTPALLVETVNYSYFTYSTP